MPVIVVGADTAPGRRILDRLSQPGREIRAFVSDPNSAAELREEGIKVALGDISDESHLAAACMNCFSAVMIAEAASDGRQRAFADGPEAVLRQWAGAAGSAGVHRLIWVVEHEPPPASTEEVAVADPARSDLADEVFRLDDQAAL